MAKTDPRPVRASRFRYGSLAIDEASGRIDCCYDLDGRTMVETVEVGEGRAWTPAAREAARLVHLLAGVSYYKAGAPPEVDLASTVVRPGEREFLRSFYLHGLGEFAYRNDLDLSDLVVTGGVEQAGPVPASGDPERCLVPFGGGIDSIVTVETLADAGPGLYGDRALFVVNRRGVARFEAIERAAEATGLPVVRAEREVDPWILRPPAGAAVFNGHVPVTGVLSALAVLSAVLDGRGAVVMSNEWSASRPNLVAHGRPVNHQWSKSAEFESAFRAVLAGSLGAAVDYYSMLRPFSELWVARRFAGMPGYHRVVHSCNRAFHLDPAARLDRWCGRCDKCCFIDLILAPFVARADLAALFGGSEPLQHPDLSGRFEALVGVGGRKPFECVGDVDECRSAAVLAAERPDRGDDRLLADLVGAMGSESAAAARAGATGLLGPLGAHHLPDALAAAALR